MTDYEQWLYLTRKHAFSKLTTAEFRQMDSLSTKLNKHCPNAECGNGDICETCGNLGLNLNESEKMLFDSWEVNEVLKKTVEGIA